MLTEGSTVLIAVDDRGRARVFNPGESVIMPWEHLYAAELKAEVPKTPDMEPRSCT